MLLKKQEPHHLSSNDEQFNIDVQTGLSTYPKKIPPKYLYDDRGSELFNQITHHPDYYLTNCELEIIEANKIWLSELMATDDFNFIELGPGEGIKPLILLKQFLKDQRRFTYFIMDLSQKYLNHLMDNFLSTLPDLNIRAIYKDYNEGLGQLNLFGLKKNFVIFLGSSIGNFDVVETKNFLKTLRRDLKPGDYLLIGFDLIKDIDVLMRAYNDSAGLTSAFNFNLLTRLNRELATNFNIKDFSHYAAYNVYNSAMESYLISLKKQQIYSKNLQQSFNFDEFEPIHIECSYKFKPQQIADFALESGFKIIKNFTDQKNYFILSLWQVHE